MPFINRYSNTLKGAITFTGNTAGLSKFTDANLQGTIASIGAFSSLNAGLVVGDFPLGTTLNIAENGSAAQLVIPPGSSIVYAELLWGGNYFGRNGNNNNVVDITGLINDPVVFSTPLVSNPISPDPLTAQEVTQIQQTTSPFPFEIKWYERSQNVTALVQAAGAGTYSVQQIPGLTAPIDNDTSQTNHAGWTLAVVYTNPTMPFRNINLFVGGELVNRVSNPIIDVPVSGFVTPPSGPVTARLLMSAQEGDASGGGDQLLFGPDVGSLALMSGPNNPVNNFFSSQINNDLGLLDTTGTFGLRNQNPFTQTNIPGGRQGWDITNIDASAEVFNTQTSAMIRFTTTQGTGEVGESYMPDMFALQIDAYAADVSIVKTDGPDPVIAGQQLTYTLVVNNAGPYEATTTIVTDNLPLQLNNTEYSIDGGLTWAPWPGSLNLGIVNINTPVTILIRGDVDPTASGTVSNTASVTSDALDPDPTNNTSSTTTQITTSADIAVVKTAQIAPAVAGQMFTYDIAVTNNGPSVAQSVILTDTVPANLQNPEYSVDGGITWIPWLGTLALGTVANGAVINVKLRGTIAADATGTLSNTADVSTSTPDPNPLNNTSTVVVPIVVESDVYVQKTASPSPVVAGEVLNYTVTVGNNGPSNATGVILNDVVPASILGAEYSVDGGITYNPWLGSLAIGNMGVAETITVLIRGTVNLGATGIIDNIATVTSTSPDPNPLNNTATVATPIDTLADLAVIKTDTPDPVVAGEMLTYNIVVTNNGPSIAVASTLTDAVPGVILNPEYSVDGGVTFNPWLGSLNLGDLNPLEVRNIIMQGTVSTATVGTITNTATVASNTPDPIITNNTSTAVTTVSTLADLAVIKTDTPDPVIAGNILNYTIVITNNGPSDAQNAVLTDVVPVEVTNPEYSLDNGVTYIPWIGNLSLGNLVNGEVRTILIRGIVDPNTTVPDITNTATISSDTVDPVPANNTSVAITVLDTSADLAVVKTDTPDPVVAGEMLTYTIVVTNNGPSVAVASTLADAVPVTVLNPEYSVDGGVTFSPWLGSLNLGNLNPLEVRNIIMQGTVDTAAAGTITNTATVTSNTPDPIIANNTSTAVTNISTLADLAVVKTDIPDPVIAGNVLNYTVVVTNNGPSDAQNAVLTDAVPVEVTSPEYSTDNGVTYTPWLGTLALGTLINGEVRTILIRGNVDPAVTVPDITNTATISSDTVDPVPANNTSVAITVLDTSADLAVVKTDTPDPVVAGEMLTYTIVVTNNGPSVAAASTLADVVPVTVLNPEYSVDGGLTFNPWIGSLNLGNLNPLEVRNIIVQGMVAADAVGTITNTATVTSRTPDPIITNNTSTAVTTVSTLADLAVVKTDMPDPVIAGNILTYTIVVTNNGPSDAQNVVLTDAVPVEVTSPEYSTDNGVTFNPWLGALALGTLINGEVRNILIRGTVDQGTTVNSITNTATVASDTVDPVPANNTSVAVTTLGTSADLAVVKTDTPDPVIAGEVLTYTIVVSNIGPSAAQSVVLTDAIPAQLTNPEYSLDGGVTFNPWLGNYNIGILPTGSSLSFIVKGTVNAGATGMITNTATVSSTTPDPDLANNTSTVDTTLDELADVMIVKTDSPSPVIAGEVITYTLEVSNLGPSDAKGVTVSDALPLELLGEEYSVDGGITFNPWSGSLVLGTLLLNQMKTVIVRATVAADKIGDITNTATVSSTTPDPNPANNTSTVVTPVNTSADVSIVKVEDKNPVVAGEMLTYTLAVVNNGPSDALGVVVNDIIPASILLPEYSIDGGNTFTPWMGAYTIGTLPVNVSKTIVIRGTVSTDATGTITNTATVISTTPDPNPSNNTSTVVTNVAQSADLAIVKTAQPTPVTAGTQLIYTLQVSNNGISDAQNVVVNDVLQAEILSPEYSLDNGSTWNAWSGSYAKGALVAGANFTVLIRGTVAQSATGTITNTATVTSTTPDPNPANNTSTVLVPVNTLADVSIVKTDTPDPVIAGEMLTYTLLVANNGPSDAQGVVVADAIPAQIQSPEYSINGGISWNAWSGNYAIGTLNAGASKTIKIRGIVNPSALGVIINTATVSSKTPDSDPTNNTSTVTTAIDTLADVSIVKTDTPDPVIAGETLNYTLVMNNIGPSDALNVEVTDTLPAAVTNAEYSIDGGIIWNTWNGSYAVGTLSLGESRTLLIRGVVDSSATGMISNTGTVSSTTPDPNLANNTSTAPTNIVTSADVSIVKANITNPVIAGEEIVYSLVVHNNGPSDAQGVVVTDVLPVVIANATYSLDNGISFAPWSGSYGIGTLVAGDTRNILIKGMMSSSVLGNVVNTATVNSTTSDPNPSNNTSTVTVAVAALADMAVVKTDSPDPVIAGEVLTYTMVITNNGPSKAIGVVLNDSMPVEILGEEYSTNNGVTWNPWSGSINLGDFEVGVIKTVQVRGNVAPSTIQPILNTAVVSSSTQDPVPSNNISTVETTVDTLANVSIVKTATPNPVTAGEMLTYTIKVANSGPSDAQNVIVTDAMPSALTAVEYSIDGGATWAVWSGSYNIGIVPAHTDFTLLIRGKVDKDTTQNILNTAIVTTTTPDPDPNNTSSTTTLINNVEIKKTSQVKGALVGDTVPYTLTITNKGQVIAENIIVKDVLTPEVAYANHLKLNAAPILGDITAGVNIGSLLVGQVAVVTFDGTVTAVPENVDKLTINQATATYQYRATPTQPPFTANLISNPNPVKVYSPSIDVTKVASSPSVVVGLPFAYTITVRNTGDIELNNVTVKDTLPTSFVVQSIKVEGVEVPGNIATGINIGTLAINQVKEVELTVVVNDTVSQSSFNNVATAEGTAQIDPNRPLAKVTDSGRDDQGIKIYNPKLKLQKSADKKYTIVGDIVTYTIQATNEGNIDLNNVQLDQVIVADILPEQLEFIAGTVTVNGVVQPQASILGGIDIGTLAVNQTKVITFKVKVVSSEGSPIENIAEADYFYQVPGLPILQGETTSNPYQLNVLEALLSVKKSADVEEAALGDTITYTVVITNEGEITASNVIFKDVLVSQVALIPGSFKVDGIAVNGVELEKGVTIGSIPVGGHVVVTYQVKVVGTTCSGMIINTAEVQFEYRLSDGTGGTIVVTDENATTQVNLQISQFKQMSVESYLAIPEVKPDVEAINSFTGSVDILSCHVIETIIGKSTEGQQLTGYKLIVRAQMNAVIEYTALNEGQSVHSAHYSIPFSTFIILPAEYQVGSKLDVTGLVEDIYYKAVDIRNFFVNITTLIDVKILMC